MGRSIGGKMSRKVSKGGGVSFGGIAVGAAIGLLITVIITALEAALANKGVLSVAIASRLSVLVWCLSGFLGGYISAKKAGKGMAVRGLVCGAIYAGVLLLITGFAFGARFGSVLKGLAIILASSSLGGVLATAKHGGERKIKGFR